MAEYEEKLASELHATVQVGFNFVHTTFKDPKASQIKTEGKTCYRKCSVSMI